MVNPIFVDGNGEGISKGKPPVFFRFPPRKSAG